MQRALRALGRRLLSTVTQKGECPFIADFSDHTFFASIEAGRYFPTPPALQPTMPASECDVAVMRPIAEYFRLRPTPQPLIRPLNAAFLARQLTRDAPRWRNSVVAFAHGLFQNGITVYSANGPRLDSARGWGSISAGPGGDSLYPIRPHRFAFLPQLTLAALYGECPIESINQIVEAWIGIAQGEGRELAYVSTLVAAQRFIAMSLAWAQVCAAEEGLARTRCEYLLLKVMSADAKFLMERIGGSVANNHLLVDGFIGWYACVLFPELKVTQKRRAEFEDLLLRELRRQILPDGSSFEHSLHYHEMCCELACAYLLWARNNGVQVPTWLPQQVARMLEFQMAMADGRTEPWAIGDTTEDPLFPLDPGGGWAAGAMRELYRGIFDASVDRASTDDFTAMRAYWLLGGFADEVPELRPRPAMRVFPNGGFVSFTECETKHQVVLRTGPGEHQPLCAGHMHADLLSVYVAVGGEPFIVDSGTYSYRYPRLPASASEVNWRAYLMGASAHNGLYIEGADPLGKIAGDFRKMRCDTRVANMRQVSGKRLCGAEGAIVSNSPYGGFGRGIVYIRGEYFLIYDQPGPAAELHPYSYGFQFAPGIIVRAEGLVCSAQSRNERLSVTASDGLRLRDVACGRNAPPAGWVSERYGKLTAAPQVRFDACDNLQLTAFLMQMNQSDGPLSIQARSEGSALRFRVDGPAYTDYVLLTDSSRRIQIAAWGLDFCGEALWLRDAPGGRIQLRWVNGTGVAYGAWRIESCNGAVIGELETSYVADSIVPGPIVGADAAIVSSNGPCKDTGANTILNVGEAGR